MERLRVRLAARFAPERLEGRREAIKAIVGAAAGLSLAATLPGCRTAAPRPASAPARDGADVVLIGAGFAGLGCALALMDQGLDVLVLEARDRVSGRVLTLRDLSPGARVEGGGEFIGTNHDRWLALARRFNLTMAPIEEDESLDAPIVLNGRVVPDAEAQRLWEAIDAAESSLTDAARVVTSPERPWLTPDAEALDARSMADWLAGLSGIDDDARAIIRALFVNDMAVALERQSYLAMLAQVAGGGLERYWTESETLRCAQGNDALASAMAAWLGPERVRLSAPVTSLTQTDDGAIVVRTPAGDRISAPRCVLAVPPSVWNRIEFHTPALDGVRGVSMGDALKYLARVRGRFWLRDPHAPDVLNDGDFGWVWESTDGQDVPEGPVLAAFSGGPDARRLHDHGRERGIRAGRAAIERAHPGFRAAATGDERWMDWPGDPWTRAGYSFPAPGTVTTLIRALNESRPPLVFAGEHCSPTFPGYMEGALRSGEAAARRVNDTATVRRHGAAQLAK